VARDMTPQATANTFWALGKLEKAPGPEAWAALERRVPQVAPDMTPQAVGNTAMAYARLNISPGPEAWAALERRVVQLAPDMNSQSVGNTVLAYATLGMSPRPEAWAALDGAAARVAPDMSLQNIANTVWSCSTLLTLRGVQLPSAYAVVWDRVCTSVDARVFNDQELRQLFHAHLMHHLLSPPGSNSVKDTAFNMPAWLMVEARDAWMRQVREHVTTSRSHKQLAEVIGELGVRHEVERVTIDGYFSMDIYLPDHDVAVEFDGPHHYYQNSHHYYKNSSNSTTRTAKTELRDLLLAKQCSKVLTVPYFEFYKLKTPKERKAYVRDKLAKEAGIIL